ncbi:MAG: DUF1697 domain-containing protein [Bacteroidales bacterium]|nr:DUF1697 domain-containing protein [Bacteroidales bacterium]
MKTYIALLQGINVGGHGKLPMTALKSLCEHLGLSNVRTYIQSGNVVFQSDHDKKSLCGMLEQGLQNKMQKHVPVIIRTVEEMESMLVSNPFPKANPSQVGVMFFAEAVDRNLYKDLVITGREEVKISGREIFIHFPEGMGRSKLKLPLERQGTVRNINTISKLVEIGKENF